MQKYGVICLKYVDIYMWTCYYTYNEAVEMLNRQKCGLIAVINEEMNYCENEIYYEWIKLG